jgi:hypothetical protein
MPTILELFRGSSKDISPKITDQTPIQERFSGSTQESAIQPTRDTVLKGPRDVIRFIAGRLTTGIRFTSKVELNNPLIYGNQAIRIATRSTPDVEKMKQATNGDAATGGLIGKALGFVTDGFIGKIAFGGRVSSLSEARNAVNSRLGIPQNLIPTAVINAGELQTSDEPNTMITLAKIKKDGAGTELGKFLKNTGGGNPKTLGRQILGQGITLGKAQIRKDLFGSPATTGINNPTPYLSSYGIFEYTSKSPYSSQINNQKFGDKKLPTATDTEATNITKKVTQLREDAKKKLGETKANSTALLKQKLTGKESKPEIDKAVESETKETSATQEKYTEQLSNYKTETIKDLAIRDKYAIDLSLVSPIKGIRRKQGNNPGRFGKTEYAFEDPKNRTGFIMPNDPTRNYTKVVASGTQSKRTILNGKGLSNKEDSLNKLLKGKQSTDSDFGDFIPLRMSSAIDTDSFVYFRAIITGLTETSSPSWESSKFVGNPYNFYTYSGVERSISFTLRTYCMSSTELALMWERLEWLTSQTYPLIKNKMVQAPFMKMTIGSIYKNKIGFINSLSYTINDDVTWETEIKDNWLPKVVDVQIEFKLVESAGAEKGNLYNYALTSEARARIDNSRKEGEVIGQDPITQPQTAKSVDIKKVKGLEDTKLPVPKVDSAGVPQSQPPASKTDNTPKDINTGKPADTPKTAENPTTVDEALKKVESEISKIIADIPKEFSEYPEWTYGTFRHSKIVAGKSGKISNIKKIDEKTYYFRVTDSNGNEDDYVAEYIDANNARRIAYFVWSAQNGGNDPISLLSNEGDEEVSSLTGYAQN